MVSAKSAKDTFFHGGERCRGIVGDPQELVTNMKIRVGYKLTYNCPQETPFLLNLNVHSSREPDIIHSWFATDPVVPVTQYQDRFDNRCTRLVAPAGQIQISGGALVEDSGLPDAVVPSASQHLVDDLPDSTLLFLLGSRYCETDHLSNLAWQLFGHTVPGWARVQAICDYVHELITFGYNHARPTRSAWEAYNERVGVCRDYAHLAIALCRCMNIPARYCTGYLGDIGMPPPYGVMDFAAWFEAYLGGRWYTFDPRNHVPRIGRVLIARGRDAADVAIATTFGAAALTGFEVWTDEDQRNFAAA
jgi:transglutaminase-like putative cysteine protease